MASVPNSGRGVNPVQQLADDYWQWRLRDYPEFATLIGCHDYDDQLDCHSLEAYKERKRVCQRFLQQVSDLEGNEQNEDDVINLALLKNELEVYLKGFDLKGYYLPIGGIENLLIYVERLVNSMNYCCEDDYEKLFSRLRKLPAQIDDFIILMQHGIQEGITAHPMVIEPCIRRFGEFIQKSVESTPFYKPFLRLKNLSNITEDKKLEIQKTGVQLIKDNLQATFKKFVSFLKEDYIPNAKCGISRSSITNGTNYYKAALTFYLTCDVTPKEVHDIGHREVKRLRGEMQKIMKKVDFEGTLQEFYEYLQRDKQFYFDNEEQYLGSFRETLERIRKQLPKYFKNIPRIELQVRGIDAGYKALINAYYVGPSPSGNRPGIVNINCSDPKTRPSYEVMSLTLHEAEPGHHLQCSYSLVQDHLPGFRRLKDERQFCTVPSRFPKNTGYIEGWGMYCEFLGEEMGMYEGDSYSLFGRYCQELVRACRCVTDTGLNFFDWSKERVAEFFHENTTFPDDLIEADIIRYMKSPGQACSYTISLMKFKELRQRAQDKLGEKFDIKEFHDVVLSCGLVPLTVLELIVNRYIEKTLKTSH